MATVLNITPLNRNFPYALRESGALPLQMFYNPATQIISYKPVDGVTVRKHAPSGSVITDTSLNVPEALIREWGNAMVAPSDAEMCLIIANVIGPALTDALHVSNASGGFVCGIATSKLDLWHDWHDCLKGTPFAAAIRPIEDALFAAIQKRCEARNSTDIIGLVDFLRQSGLNNLYNRMSRTLRKK